MPICQQCGYEKFHEDTGYFYCDVCHMQSQDIQNTVYETDFTGQAAFTSRANALKIGANIQKDDGDLEEVGVESRHGRLFAADQPESLFLLVDVVLRAQVEWLIQNAGARKELADVVKSVWFSYLSLALPDLRKGIKQSLLTGGTWNKTLRKPDIAAIGNCKVDDLTKLLEHWRTFSSEEDDENLPPIQVKDVIKTPTKRGRSKSASSAAERPNKLPRTENPSRISLARMVALMVISLGICEEIILVSDILRWIRQLRLPCVDPSNVLPDYQLTTFYLLGKSDEPLVLNYHELEWELVVMRNFLQIPRGALPSQSATPVIARFVQELSLPADLIGMVVDFAESLGIRWTLDFCATSRLQPRIHPQNIEATVMALIILCLKTLCGLDDDCERTIRTHSREIAKIMDLDLFDVLKWVDHMNLRRLKLFQHTSLLSSHSVVSGLGFVRENFLTEKRKLNWTRLTLNKYQDENYEDLQRAFQEANFHHRLPDLFVDLPVTQQPFRAHTDALTRICPSLNVDFGESVLDHLVGGFEQGTTPEVELCLKAISLAQDESRKRASLIGVGNLKLSQWQYLLMDRVPSSILRWLITVCAEVIEHKPAALLGTVVAVEAKLFGKTKKPSRCQLYV